MKEIKRIKSRHPKIHYWFWDDKTIVDKQYMKDIDNIVANSSFDMLFLTERGNLNFWDPNFKPIIREMVEYAHAKGIMIGVQFWQNGMFFEQEVDISEAVAIVTEHEVTLGKEKVVINAHSKNVHREPMRPMICEEFPTAPPLKSELIFAGAFKKTRDGFYEEGSFIDITNDAITECTEDPGELNVTFNRADLEGYTVYVMVSHYHKFHDVFSNGFIDNFKDIMDVYSDVPLDGFGVDEFRSISLSIELLYKTTNFRERIYGKSFHDCYKEQTGEDLIQTMFEMRYCPENHDEVRIKAINNYFDVFRKGVVRNEEFIADYALKIFGEDTFIGVHNTFHNHLQNDEIWHTGCSWWDVPRKYAQTDEEIGHPMRMGIACGCQEHLVYDMFYHLDKNVFFEKAVRDARYNSRIHYHAMNDGSKWGIDTGTVEFLQEIEKIESKITLLNIFDPVLPKMELLVVFGFPALCNWYPDEEARNELDINEKIDIEDRVENLWKEGYLNALAPSDAIIDGRITLKDGKYDYCGHTFNKMLYLYPEYSKNEVISFLETAVARGYEIKIIGEYTHTFEGQPAMLNIDKEFLLEENADVVEALHLTKNPIQNGCISEDGSVIISDYDSVMTDGFCTYDFEINGHLYEAEFRGTFALKTDENGNIEKLVAGNLKYLKKDGEILITTTGEDDYIFV